MKSYPHPSGESAVKWVSAGWLQEHLEDKNMNIVDAQPDVHDYIQEHIPGAVYMSEGLLRASLKGRPAVYVPQHSIEAVFRRTGIDSKVPTVVYTGKGSFRGWGDGLEQTMIAYSLARFGHNHVYVLDGGIDKWKQEGMPLTKAFPRTEESNFRAETHTEYFIEHEEFITLKDRQDVVLLDARPTAFYEGQGPWAKPGHIPGAISFPWANLMDKDNKRLLKPDEEVHSLITQQGITRDKTVICSCGTGREATNEFLLFKWYLGYPKVRIHEGSFTEWCAHPENPTVTGSRPR